MFVFRSKNRTNNLKNSFEKDALKKVDILEFLTEVNCFFACLLIGLQKSRSYFCRNLETDNSTNYKRQITFVTSVL